LKRFIVCLIASSAYLIALAQLPNPDYVGYRAAIFNLSIKGKGLKQMTVSCDVANTGRMDFNAETPDSLLVVELDTLNLPPLLIGCEALRRADLKISNGAIQKAVDFQIRLKSRGKKEEIPPTDAQHCADLRFDTAYIIQYLDDAIQIQYTIRNVGNIPALLVGKLGQTDENLAFNLYFVTGQRLSRGAIKADVGYIREGFETTDGLLQPGQKLVGLFELTTKNRTKFASNIILELDPFQKVEECDRTNNNFWIEARY
jgi:hypothetical protein